MNVINADISVSCGLLSWHDQGKSYYLFPGYVQSQKYESLIVVELSLYKEAIEGTLLKVTAQIGGSFIQTACYICLLLMMAVMRTHL